MKERSPLRRHAFAGGAKAILVLAAWALSFSATYAASHTAFSNSDLVGILALGGAVHGALLLAVLAVWVCRRRAKVVNALLAVAAVLGVGSAHAIHTDLLLDRPWVLGALLAAAGFALFVAFGAIDRSPLVGPALAALCSLATIPFVANLLLRGSDTVMVTGDTSNLRHVTFRHRPNLYFVSFDGIAPRVLLRKYMGLETTPFHDLFESRFRRFENFFVDAVYTKQSLGSLLALDEHVFRTMKREVRERTGNAEWDPMLFSGQSPSPLLGLLKNNGYETTTAYENEYFGKRKGPFVDHYFTGSIPSVCGLLDDRVRAVSFWGYCLLTGQEFRGNEMRRRVIDQIGEASLRAGPQFALAHIWRPGHAYRSLRYSDQAHMDRFRASYLRGSTEAAALLARLLAHLDENDPDGILFVYGDHGPFLIGTMAFAAAPEFVVQDHFGVLGGVHPPTACQEWFDAAQKRRGYMTLLDATHALLRCLSGGRSVLRTVPAVRMVGDWSGKMPGGNTMSYEKFLYE